MGMQFFFLINRQGKTRLASFFSPIPVKERQKVIREVARLVLARPAKLCNVIEWHDGKLIYKRSYFLCLYRAYKYVMFEHGDI